MLLVFRPSQIFLINSASFNLTQPSSSLIILTIVSICLIYYVLFSQSSVIRFVISSCCWSLMCIYFLWLIADSFCQIFSNLYLFYSLFKAECFELSQKLRPLLSIFYSIQTIILILNSKLTVMIYMRERANDKKSKVQNSFKKNIIEQLKNKMSRVAQEKRSSSPLRQEGRDVQNHQIAKEPHYQPYKIAKRYEEFTFKSNQHSLNDQKLCQSIVIDDRKAAFSRKKKTLTLEKNFDIQIFNSLGSRVTLQNYIKLVQKQNQALKLESQKVKNELQRMKTSNKTKQSKIVEQLEYNLLQQTVKNTQNELTITKYQKYFNQCKSLLLNVAMELIQAKNTLGLSISSVRLIEKQHQLAKCLEKMEKMIAIYSHFLKQSPKQLQKADLAFDELNSIVKYQQKTIEKLTESKNVNTAIQHENGLLRYEVNRLSKQNQVLISELASLKLQNKVNVPKTVEKLQNTHKKENQESFCQTQEDQKDQTPIIKLQDLRESIKTPFEIQPKEAKSLKENQLAQMQSQLEQKSKMIKNLQIQKDYISDQLMSIEKDMDQLKREFKDALQEKQKYCSQLQLLNEQYKKLESQNAILEEHFSLKQDNVALLQDKIRQLQERKQPLRESNKYVQLLSGNENVTVQTLLKFLKRKELIKYHEALMQLINQYESRIAKLNTSYVEQKGIREQLYNYCRDLTSLVNSQNKLTLEKVVNQINKYYEKVEQVKQNEIDKLLRKVKCFSIGIDHHELSNIQVELQDYIVQLQSRLPTLSEAYLEDGSSVNDSYNVSIQNFQA